MLALTIPQLQPRRECPSLWPELYVSLKQGPINLFARCNSNRQPLPDYVNLYMHPQAIIIDSSATEEHYFLSGIRDEIRGTGSTLIELPERPGNRFSWLSKLDASALAGKASHFHKLF